MPAVVKTIALKLGQVCIGSAEPKCRRIPHSPNRLNSLHWGEKKRWKDAWEEEVGWAWIRDKMKYEHLLKDLPFKKAQLEIFIFSIQAQDTDNAYASMKGIIDGLRKVKLITDDDPSHLRVKITQAKVAHKEGERVELTIKEIK